MHPLLKAIFLIGFLIISGVGLYLAYEMYLLSNITPTDPTPESAVIFDENNTTLSKNDAHIVLTIIDGEKANVTKIEIFESSNKSNTANFTFTPFSFIKEEKAIRNYTFNSDLKSGNYSIQVTYDISDLTGESVTLELFVPIILEGKGWRQFWVANVSTSDPIEFYIINATLKVNSSHSLIYSNSLSVLDSELLDMNDSFESDVYPTLTNYFGLPPDIDGNGKIILLVFDIDPVPPGVVVGFFYVINQYLNSQLKPSQRFSNEAEILHIDIVATNNVETIAHEFQHLIHFGHDEDEETWLDEGASMFSEYLIGNYPLTEIYGTSFQSNPDVSLTYWDSSGSSLVFANYGASYAFMLYLAEHYGGDPLVQDLVERSANGIQSVEEALFQQGYDVQFTEIFRNWTIANYLDDPSFADGYYGYTMDDIPTPAIEYSYDSSSSIGHTDNSVPYWGTDYLKLNHASNLSFSFEFNSAADAGFLVTVILKNTTNIRVIPVELLANGSGSFFLDNVQADEIYVVISSYTIGDTPDYDNEEAAPSQEYWFTVN
ncbi:MAG: hypothetical protein KAT16_05150 [Candidatus Heimdallarchaeota archaeon]|nr:hypothetical protein [Candidatus Heimdallarchaeota archaeon]